MRAWVIERSTEIQRVLSFKTQIVDTGVVREHRDIERENFYSPPRPECSLDSEQENNLEIVVSLCFDDHIYRSVSYRCAQILI